MWLRSDLKSKAKEVLRKNYLKALVVSVVVVCAGGGPGTPSYNWHASSQDKVGFSQSWSNFSSAEVLAWFAIFSVVILTAFMAAALLRILLGYPIEVGGKRFFVRSAQQGNQSGALQETPEIEIKELMYGFNHERYKNIVAVMFWRSLINFLWFLLLIVPGIIKSYAFRMVPYILAENPSIDRRRALEISTRMTEGHKFSMFVLELSFIGWYLLGMLALGVGVLLVTPYVNATFAELYLVLRDQALASGSCTAEDLGQKNTVY